MSSFSFSFSGDDIEDVSMEDHELPVQVPLQVVETGSLHRASSSAFPIAGKPLIQPSYHDLVTMLKMLPSKIAYSTLVIKLDDGTEVSIPRRELWDVRVQLMAEEDDEGLGNLGKDDVKTGVYEGGFKSWESSVDLVKELQSRRLKEGKLPNKLLEVGLFGKLLSRANVVSSLVVGQRFHPWQLYNGIYKIQALLIYESCILFSLTTTQLFFSLSRCQMLSSRGLRCT
jgi:hypothetical protein